MNGIYAATQCLDGVRTVKEGLERLEDMGLTHVELSGPHRPDPAIVEAAKEFSFKYAIHNYFPAPVDEPFVLNLSSSDPVIATRSIEHVRQNLRLAKDIGAALYSVHGGFRCDCGPDFRFNPGEGMLDEETSLANFLERMEALQAEARQSETRLTVENNVLEPHNHALSPEDPILSFLGHKDFDAMSSRFGPGLTHIDVAHLKITCNVMGWNLEDEMARLSSSVGSIHISDNDGIKDQNNAPDKDSWFLPWLAKPEFQEVPLILECRGLSPDALTDAIHLVDDARRGDL